MGILQKRIAEKETSRRGFLIGSTGTGLMMAFTGVGLAGCSQEQAPEETAVPEAPSEQLAAGSFEPTVWFKIDPDGRTLIHIAKAEMGQHVGTALARVISDELEADWDKVEIVHVDTDPKWGYMVTGGSWSVHTTFFQLSRAGAAGRIALLEAGAAMLGAQPADCKARDGAVHYGDQSVSYGEIVSKGGIERQFTAEELEALPVKAPEERRKMGQPVRALDVREKSTGEAVYGIDVELPGMVFARPLLPPTRYGSKVNGIDDSAAKEVPGYRQSIQITDPSNKIQGWVAVIADTYPAAMKAADLVSVDWEPGPTATVSEQDILDRGQALIDDTSTGALWVDDGDADAAFEGAEQVVEATYRTATALHMQLEPVNALATFEDGIWHIHGGNQWQSLILPVLAEALEVPEDKIILHQYYLGGGFGRRLYGDYMIPAALASKALGVPVKMVFTREDDTRFDSVRSPSVQRVRLAADGEGTVKGMTHEAAAGWPTLNMAPGFLAPSADGTEGQIDTFSIAGTDHWYTVGAHRVRAITNPLANETFLPGWLRAVGPGWTTWALESFMDEAALALGQDPVAFRLALLDGAGKNAGTAPASVGGASRQANVLRRLAEKCGWDNRADMPDDTGMGIATSFGQERNMPTWTGCAALVSVDRETGQVTAEKLWSVVDVGQVVHPEGAMSQTEGATLWGLSLALYEGSSFVDGQPKDRNLDTYTPLRMNQVPEMDIELIDSTEMPSGLGEPPMSVVAPAIANAIHAAVGVRIRDLPIRPDAILAALAQSEEGNGAG